MCHHSPWSADLMESLVLFFVPISTDRQVKTLRSVLRACSGASCMGSLVHCLASHLAWCGPSRDAASQPPRVGVVLHTLCRHSAVTSYDVPYHCVQRLQLARTSQFTTCVCTSSSESMYFCGDDCEHLLQVALLLVC